MNNQEIQNLIKDLIEKMAVTVNSIEITENNGKSVVFSVEVSEPHFFVSRDGEGLFSLNHLVKRIVESKNSPDVGANILVDVNGFHKKRMDSVKAVAHMMAERARYFKTNVEVDPMSAFDRRVVHEFLANETDLKTESMGDGPSRRVVIKYLGGI
ncbi:MAG: R3H domain-containing nucleic acid-binding protein [Patescibacteria group bacterium]